MYSVAVDTRKLKTQKSAHRPNYSNFNAPAEPSRDVAFDVTGDGQRFFMLGQETGDLPATRLIVVLNWFEELKRLVPTGR